MDDWSGKRVTVMGLGRFGGGLGVTRWLCERGADVLLTDLAEADALAKPVTELEPLIDAGQVTLRLGGHNVSDFTGCDAVVASPAVPKPWENRFLRAAEAAGVAVTTEIALAMRQIRSQTGPPLVGVTGTFGKSTTVALIAEVLRSHGVDARAGGNLGGSLLRESAASPDAVWVVELSSAMLYWLGREDGSLARCRVGVFTGLSPNHLDWHGSEEHYRESKAVLFRALQAGDAVVSIGDGPAVAEGVRRCEPPAITDDGVHERATLSGEDRRRVLVENASRTACDLIGIRVDHSVAFDAVGRFPGLPHRMRRLGRFGGVLAIDDSKSTTPETAAHAVRMAQRLGPGVVHLIAGGADKGVDMAEIGRLASESVRLYSIGTTGPAIAAAAGAHGEQCETLERAVERIAEVARDGDVVLLSPGCASWDQFENYEQRGRVFAALVETRLGRRA